MYGMLISVLTFKLFTRLLYVKGGWPNKYYGREKYLLLKNSSQYRKRISKVWKYKCYENQDQRHFFGRLCLKESSPRLFQTFFWRQISSPSRERNVIVTCIADSWLFSFSILVRWARFIAPYNPAHQVVHSMWSHRYDHAGR